jgi:hypothetical protein
MSTHCGVAVKAGETFNTIYCHWNGNPEYMLPMLRENYNSLELATKLISFGDASIIKKKLEPETYHHTFDNPDEDVCVFYHRDRGEEWFRCSSACFTQEHLFQQPVTYFYIFEDGEWNAYHKDGRKVQN